ncbi:hypothetical protein M406DRAFT_344998 [Cryphonectria parasitica EP155]|uniref:Large ribosomal subunit protein bL21m n=1 Tax=Cryphonectria parasitica (strain ATCC 38755 / EP155) TaxID=660469 RepID=A0A9P4YA87_CRYP1|nr:uncharacterized protein M406DRAFT_344998 [Cryphonectria parasitica EP155]KAF3769167.1 hypothetical protein M406DRAFT_344998 [Cryphonectria parasitica EP155]
MSKSLLRSALELRSPVTRLPPTFLLPIRARWISSSSSQAPTEPTPQPAAAGPVPDSVLQLLPLLRSQPNHYITVHINGRPYLVTPGDSVRLPFLMPGVAPGDVLRLNRASVLGSRDFTLRPTNPSVRKSESNEVAYIDERLFECRATVVGVDSEPMRIKEKTKRRNRRVRTVKSKHRYTVLRISELKIKSPAEVEG